MPRLGAKVSLLRCTLLSSLLLLLVCSIHETEQNSYCQQIITERHLAELQELADTQMQHPGRVSFKFIDKMQLNDSICYVKAAFPLLGKILERTEFKENSSNARKMQTVRRMYHSIDENVDPCIREEDDEERMLSQMCFKEFTTSPYEMLVLVKDFFQDINQLLQNQETFEKDCSHVYHRACLGPRGAESPPEQRRKEPPGREGLQEPLVFVVVPGVVAVLLAVGGLLFYKYKCRVLEQPLEDGDCDPEEPERRALQGVRECPELETQDL
ncbi:PREDICTED: macrophage colony-stimulating factor 1 isoform X2 [Lepidothrix coronata]|uniref:Macrophage colony-stimulating factor 1 isoform X2 n=1 Tax=Lepidothrix coronata TaxID=321398 RepID=A0A6J0HQI3_9PASS|nr:PREDICTED: macrophage colony-stimulating factor 1 isoform X2 [Lepidothrix coronata]